MTRSTALALTAMFVLVALLQVAPSASAQAAPTWWDPTTVRGPADFRQGWNVRVPILVVNRFDYPVTPDHPLMAHLHAGHLAAEAGWLQTRVGGLPTARSFTLDPDSVRLVEYGSNWVGGASSLVEVPIRTHLDWFEPDQTPRYGRSQSQPFEPSSNPVVTIVWLPRAPIPPGGRAYYYAYFDATQNSEKSAPDVAPLDQERLGGTNWVGRGTELWGFVIGSLGRSVQVTASQPNTRVWVYEYAPGFPTPSLRQLGNTPNPFVIDQPGNFRDLQFAPPDVAFKVVADKPVVVQQRVATNLTDFVPSLDGNLLGTRFYIDSDTETGAFLMTHLDGADVTIRSPGQPDRFVTINGIEGYAEIPLEPGSRNEIVADAPILVQPRPRLPGTFNPNHMTQVPSLLTGAPLGRWFYGSTLSFSEGGLFRVLGVNESSHPTIFPLPLGDVHIWPPLESGPVRLDPRFENRRDLRTLPVAFFGDEDEPRVHYSQPHFAWSNDGEDIPEDQRGRFAFFVGRFNPITSLGGDAAMHFAVPPGTYAIFAQHNGTRLELRQSGAAPVTRLLERDGYFTWTVSTGASREIASNKPLVVVPTTPGVTAYSRYLAGRLPQPDVQVLTPEFRGFLMQVRSPDGADPVFVSIRPGQNVRVPIEVRNLGRWSGGVATSDTADLQALPAPNFPGTLRWEGSASGAASIPLGGGQGTLVPLEISVPQGTPSGTSSLVRVVVTSQRNPNLSDSLQLVLFFEQDYGVDLFWEDGGSTNVRDTTREQPLGSRIFVPFILQNKGSATDSFRFQASPASLGWETQIVRSPSNLERVTRVDNVESDGSRRFYVMVEAPETAAADVFTPFVLQAFSTSSSTAGALIQALFRLDLRREIRLDADARSLDVAPGQSVKVTLRLSNLGEDAVTLNVSVPTDLPTGWQAAIVLRELRTQSLEVSVEPGRDLAFDLEVSVPAGARHREFAALLVQAAGVDSQANVRDVVGFVAQVLRRDDFQVSANPRFEASPGDTLAVPVHVEHRGNSDGSFVLYPHEIPLGWSAGAPTTVNLSAPPPGAGAVSGTLELDVAVPPDAEAGSYNIALRVQQRDGPIRNATIEVLVVESQRAGVGVPSEATVIGPGETVRTRFVLRNEGNTPLTYRVEAQAPAGWEAFVSPSHVTLGAARNGSVSIHVTAPSYAEPGMQVVDLAVSVVETQSTGRHPLAFDYRLPDLAALSVHALTASAPVPGDVLVFRALVANIGDAPASNVAVVLEVDGQRVDRVVLERLDKNATASATLQTVWPAELPILRVYVDPDLEVPEGDETNNALPIELSDVEVPAAAPLPAPLFLAVLLVLVVAVLGRRAR